MLLYQLRKSNPTPFPRPENMSEALHALLISRGIGSAEEAQAFLHPGIDQLIDPFLLSNMHEAVARIRAAIAAKEHICIFGDYDVDGISASALLSMYLISIGADVEVYLPSRHEEGYGLNEPAIRELATRATLLITVDCGITSATLIDLAKSLGMDAIVTDHHEPAEVLPDCPVVNPLLGGYPFPKLCGAGVAFKLVHALGGLEAALPYIDIAALATVQDVMPLVNENRVIVTLGLEAINARPRLGLQRLLEAAGIADRRVNAGTLGFQIGPRLNAGGRIGSAKRSFDLLVADDPERAQAIAEALESENTFRKKVQQQILDEAEAQLEDFDFPAHRCLVLAGDGWNTGVIGLAASKLVEKYNYPTILLSNTDGILHGSCRSIPGVDIHAALTSAKALMLNFGGHKQAAGLSMKLENLDALREALDRTIFENAPAECFIPVLQYDGELELNVATEVLIQELEALQPCGFGNPTPLFRTHAQLAAKYLMGKDKNHLKLRVAGGGTSRNAVFFSHAELYDRLGNQLDLLYNLNLNSYNGSTEVQLMLKSVHSTDSSAEISAKLHNEAALQLNFLTEMFYNRGIINGCTSIPEISTEALTEMLKSNFQGTLILVNDLKQTIALMDLCPEAPPDIFLGELPSDPRAFNAICAYAPLALPRGYRRVITVGIPLKIEGAETYCLKLPTALQAQLPDVDQMRETYKALLRLSAKHYPSFLALATAAADMNGLTPTNCAAAMLALNDMQLIQLNLDKTPIAPTLNEMRKISPESSAVWRTLQAWRS